MLQTSHHKKRGFTLLELVVVMAIVSLILPAMLGLFFVTMRSQRKVLVLQEVKRNGDNALTTMESLIKRQAISIHTASPPTQSNKVCDAVESYTGTLYFADPDDTWFSFSQNVDAVASESALGLVDLTNDDVVISNFSIECERTALFSSPIVRVSFTVTQSGTSTRPEDSATLDYASRIKLRAF